MHPFARSLFVIFLVIGQVPIRAQDPSLAPANLDFSSGIFQNYHYAAWVSLGTKGSHFTHYQYDHYPDQDPNQGAERIKADDGVFARRNNGNWMKSDDWAETGTPVAPDLADELNFYVNVIRASLAKPEGQRPQARQSGLEIHRENQRQELHVTTPTSVAVSSPIPTAFIHTIPS